MSKATRNGHATLPATPFRAGFRGVPRRVVRVQVPDVPGLELDCWVNPPAVKFNALITAAASNVETFPALFLEIVEAWNAEDADGQPLPCNEAHLLSLLDWQSIWATYRAWLDARALPKATETASSPTPEVTAT